MNTFVNYNTPLLDPGAALESPLGGTKLATIRLDETDHNVEPVDDTPADFNMDEITGAAPVKPIEKKVSTEDDPNEEVAEEVAEEVEDEVKEPAAKDATTKPQPDAAKPEDIKTEDEPKELPKSRDYSGLDADDVKVLKGTNNYHFKKFFPLLQKYVAKAKEGETFRAKAAELEKAMSEKGVPPTWYEHPEAYTLTPEFRTIQGQYDRLSGEQSFIEQQLTNIKDGKPFVEIQGYDGSGNPIYTAERPPTNADEVRLTRLLQQYGSAEQMLRSKVISLQGNFHTQHKTAAQDVKSALKTHLDNVIPELRPTEKETSVFMQAIPATFKGHPMAEVAAQVYGLCIKQAQMIQSLRATATKAGQITKDVARAGATTSQPKSKTGTPPAAGMTKLPNGKLVPSVYDIADFNLNDHI